MSKSDLTDAFRSRGIHRRNFIKTIGVGAAGAAVVGTGISLSPTTAQAQTSTILSKYTEQLPVPAVINAKSGGTFLLSMAAGLQRFHSALPLTPTWGYGGADAFALGGLKAPEANEEGWKDTIQANPGEITRILVPFGAQIPGIPSGGVPFGQSFTGGFVWHCHILDHEDNEMMQKYDVV